MTYPQNQPGGYNPYGVPQPGYAMREHPDGTTVLVMGILGLVTCPIIGIFAWVKGNAALAEIDAHPGVYSNRSSVSAGRICGIISCVLVAIYVVGFFGIFAVTFLGSAASTG